MADLNRPGPVPPSSLSLSTTTMPARDRLPVWREVFGQTMVRLDIEPVKQTSFHAEGELCVLPGAAFASVTVTPVKVSRTQKLIAEDMEDMAFVITADVPFHVTQNGPACGFGDLSYFNRTFRRSYGITPTDLRNAGLVAQHAHMVRARC